MVEKFQHLESEAVDLLHDLGGALHLLTLKAQEALKGCFLTYFYILVLLQNILYDVSVLSLKVIIR